MGQSLSGKLIFMGTPGFAAASFRALVREGMDVAAVFTQPDKPVGRRRILTAPPVKVFAESEGIPVYQPRTLKDESVVKTIRAIRPEAIIVAAYGKILPRTVLAVPPMGCINVHASLLPRHRGASPIAHAIWSGDTITGVTIMRMDEGLDTGPMLLRKSVPLPADATTESLTPILAELGADLLVDALRGLQAGMLEAVPQDEAEATYAGRLKSEDGRLDFSQPAEKIERQVRAFRPWPGTYFVLDGRKIKVLKARVGEKADPDGEAGEVAVRRTSLGVRCGDGTFLELLELQREGGRPLPAEAFLRGFSISKNILLPAP